MIYTLAAGIEIALQKLYNFGLRRRFPDAARLYLHRSARIINPDAIVFGRNVTALVGFRIEAVTEYQGTAYNPRIVIKNDVTFNDYVHIGATNYVEIGNNVLVASKVFISDHIHGDYSGAAQSPVASAPAQRALTRDRSVVIEDNVWICESVSILPGVRVGAGSIIGAHSVVTKDIPPGVIAVGTPARVVKRYNAATRQWDRIDG